MLLDLERGLIVELPQLMQLQHNRDVFYMYIVPCRGVCTSSSKPTLWKVLSKMSCLQCIHMKPESNLGTDYLGQTEARSGS